MADFSRLSLFTRNHGDHDPEWTLQGARQDSLICMPCIVEMLEDSEELVVRKRFVLGELLQMMGSNSRMLLDMLADNQRLAWHIMQTLNELLETHREDATIIDVITELLVQLCCQLECEELVCCLLQQISIQVSKDVSYQYSLPSLVLLGQLLNNIPALADVLIETQGTLMTYLISTLDASEEKTKVASVYALLKVLGSTDQLLPIPMYGQLANRMMSLLSGAETKELQQNSMELLKKLVENGDITRALMQQGSRSGLPSALKKMLMSRDTTLKVTSMQCVHQILSQDKQDREVTHYSDDLLDADIAEFLFEALATTDGNLLSSTFRCLSLFTECQGFFTKCHTVYGIESIVRALHHCVKLNNAEALHQGMTVLSEILKRQPEDIHLLNGLGIHKQIDSLLQTCLKHTDIGIQIQTGYALQHLLRKHHLPKPVDYNAVISLLQTMQDAMEKLPRPISKPSSRHHRHQRKIGKDGMKDITPSREEKLLLCGFDMFKQAFSLVDSLLTDSSPESHMVLMSLEETSQTADKNTLKHLQYFLLRFLDTTCIPIFMMNYAHLSDPAGLASFFHILCSSFKFNIDLKDFAQKLAGCSFIQLSIDVKNKITKVDRDSFACDVINKFLGELCVRLVQLSQTDSKEMHQVLEQGLPLIRGSCSDLLSILCQHTPTIASFREKSSRNHIDVKQKAVLALLYAAFLHSDRLVSEADLEESLDIFLDTNQDFESMSLLTRKHLLFLCAVCFCANNASRAQMNNVHRFQEQLPAEDLRSLYSHHPVMFHWCCTSDTLHYDLAKTLFEMWILNLKGHLDADITMDNSSEDIKITLELLQTNAKSLSTMLDLLCRGDDNIVEKVSWLTKAILNHTSPTGTSMIVEVLQDKLPTVIQKLFLKDDCEVKDIHCVALLDLLCCVHMTCHIPEMESISAKLAYHVCNLLSKESTSNTELIRVALNYLTCLMVRNDNNADNRVALVILSSSGVLRMLEELVLMTDKQVIHTPEMATLQACALSLLAQLIDIQSQTNIKVSPRLKNLGCRYTRLRRRLQRPVAKKVQYQIKMDLTPALDTIQRSTRTITRVCGTKLWTSLTTANFQSPLLKLNEERDAQVLLDDVDVGIDITAGHLRKLLIILQNNMLKGDSVLCVASVHCLHALMLYTNQKNKDLGKHLMKQPWNQLLLSQCVDLCETDGMLLCGLKLINLFVKFGSDRTVVNQAMVDAVLERVVKHEQRETSSNINHVSAQYIDLIKQILDVDSLRISVRLREKVVSQMKAYMECPENTEEHCTSAILLMQGVILPVSSPSGSIQDMKSEAGKIHTNLKSLM